MATVTGDYEINFALLPNESPYTNPDFLAIVNAGTARIASGVWRSVDLSDVGWLLDPDKFPASGDVMRSKVEISDAGGAIDGIVVYICDTLGNGYRVLVATWGMTRHRMDAFVPFVDSGAEDFFTVSNGDQVELEYNKATGAVRVYHNGDPIESLNLTDSTYSSNTLAPGFMHAGTDQAQGGIISFAADGVVVGSDGASPVAKTMQFLCG